MTRSQAQALLAACERRDAASALMQMRSVLAAAGAVMSKSGQKGYRAMERQLTELAETGGEKPPAKQQVKGLAFLARAAGAQVNPGRN